MNGKDINFENVASDWHEGFDDDYVSQFDKVKQETEDRRLARARIEAMREQQQLNDMLYDVLDDPDAIN